MRMIFDFTIKTKDQLKFIEDLRSEMGGRLNDITNGPVGSVLEKS